MTIVDELPNDAAFDYVIVGGGTAGCVIASRLAEGLPDAKILMIEGGKSDFGNETILNLRGLMDLWGQEGMDYGYTSVPQPFGNSNIVHSRAKMLGGCSSHNAVISFLPFELDLQRWQKLGAKGWTHKNMLRLYKKLRNNFIPVDERHRSTLVKDWIKTCSRTFQVPVVKNMNQEISQRGKLSQGTGYLNLAYNPENGHRESASVAYIHPILRGDEQRPNLTILQNTRVLQILFEGDTAVGVKAQGTADTLFEIRAKSEVILCAGAIDTPRLMLLSGLGPREHLESIGISLKQDLPGVGENLQDHVDSLCMWELNEEVPSAQTITGSEAVLFLRREAPNAQGDDADEIDIMFHIFTQPFDIYTKPLGYDTAKNAFCIIPYIARPASVGRVYLTSADPAQKPAVDNRYFSDEKGYDKDTLLFGVKMARKLAQEEPFKSHLKRELAPGDKVVADDDLDVYARNVSNTVYHPCGTAKMGDVEKDDMAVVDPTLKVRGIKGLRVADASIFPCMTSINPMVTVLCIGERAAELILEDATKCSQ